MRRELLAGLTTFMTMAYVVVVNPQILGEGGMPVDGVLFATCVSAAIATVIMGLWANYPIALAPGMSLNAYFTYSIVLGRGVPWQTALGVVFLSGLPFLILTLSRMREQIVNGIPDCLKHGTAAGIGLFIAFIGLHNAKIIVANPATFVGLGKSSDPQVLLAAAGLLFIAILMARRARSARLARSSGCSRSYSYCDTRFLARNRIRHWECRADGQADSLASDSASIKVPRAMSSGEANSSGRWLYPLRQGMNSMPAGAMREMKRESW